VGASAAAIPPCAQNEAVWASGERLTSATRAPASDAVSAEYSPAAPAPTTATSTRSGWEALTAGTVPARVPVYFSHPSSLEHDTGLGHPECADRIRAIEAELERRDWVGYERREAPAATRDQLLAVHPESYVELVREICLRAGAFDMDTPTSGEGSWDAALHAAGGACALVEALLGGERVGFSALRPPGHHAEVARGMGFCLFANASIAARHALASGAQRVLVLDWDVHHGNGTNAIFHESPEVLFASLHQYPFWPGTGALSDVGSGAGEGYSLNLPVPAGGGEAEYCGLVEHIVLPAARAFDPDLVLVSAGYDAHRDDPLAECTMETASYAQLALLVLGLGKPVGYLLEGGYDLGALAASVAASMEALAGGGEPASFPRGPLVERAAGVLGRWWELSSPA
jgi:acetoin utilization deacetylase AcuC-like enzyme